VAGLSQHQVLPDVGELADVAIGHRRSMAQHNDQAHRD
jgi:hypothetical protein